MPMKSNYHIQILSKIRDTIRKQMELGYDTDDMRVMLAAFDIAIRENGALDFLNQKELDQYHLGMNIFLEKHLTII